ncbi:hypothetical protein COM61_00835 [Bacillus toyonensis]|nr:hypothetical protein COM61_00835 [Bacillus toyonensis]
MFVYAFYIAIGLLFIFATSKVILSNLTSSEKVVVMIGILLCIIIVIPFIILNLHGILSKTH